VAGAFASRAAPLPNRERSPELCACALRLEPICGQDLRDGMPPMSGKICSLLPSATEIVFALGLDDQLVGVTHECDFPQAAQRLPIVTRSVLGHEVRDSRDIHRHIATALHEGSSLYVLDQDLLERLDPELILTQELCDVCAVSYTLVEEAVRRLSGRRHVLSLEPTLRERLASSRESRRNTGEHRAGG